MKSKDENRVGHAKTKYYLQLCVITIPQSCKCYHQARPREKDQMPSPDMIEHSQ